MLPHYLIYECFQTFFLQHFFTLWPCVKLKKKKRSNTLQTKASFKQLIWGYCGGSWWTAIIRAGLWLVLSLSHSCYSSCVLRVIYLVGKLMIDERTLTFFLILA